MFGIITLVLVIVLWWQVWFAMVWN